MSRELAQPIAVVGVACEYPDASSADQLWENVLAQRRAFRRMPAERLRLEDYLSTDRSLPDSIYSTEVAVLEGYGFDRVAFRVSGPSFRAADLAHWLALDVSHRALADAGFGGGQGLPRDTTAVVIGNTLTGEFSRANLMRLRWPYVRRIVDAALRADGLAGDRRRGLLDRIESEYKRPFEAVGDETLAGGLSNTIAGRICNHLDLHGGGYSVDGACAASLLAIATACAQLDRGDVDVALAGGVDLSLDPFELVGFAKVGALAANEMRVYDARSAGFWPGEGCGVVVLTRLADAIADRRRVHAIVRGWGVSSDGAGGLTRPDANGQQLALSRAYARAGVQPTTVALYEGHGTGTAVGDATELRAVAAVRGRGGAAPAAIGSIKANIGHTKAAAGVAGFLKAAIAVRERVIPPTTGAERPHPELERAADVLRVPRAVEAWPEGLPVRAGVSAMGFGGINSHLVLDGPEQEAPRRPPRLRERMLAASAQDAELFAFAAETPSDLERQVARLRRLAPRLSRAELGDAATALATHAPDGRFRAAVVASTPAELADRLDAVIERLGHPDMGPVESPGGVFVGSNSRAPRIGLLLPGQGSPSPIDGGALQRRFPTLIEDLYESICLPAVAADPVATEVAQPTIVTASLAGLRVLAELGVEADVAVGHSLGELTALVWAGVVGEAAAQRIAAARGRAMADLSQGTGAMVSVGVCAEEAERLAGELPVVIAGLNAPAKTVLAGPADAIDALLARARRRDVPATRLPVSHAFHSPLVAPAGQALANVLAVETVSTLRRAVVSTVTGSLLDRRIDVRELLQRQVTSPVRFAEAIKSAAANVDVFIEAGPGSVLTRLAAESVAVPAWALDAGGASLSGLLACVAATWTLGAPVRMDALFAGRFARPFDPEHELSFLSSPCERAPLPADPPAPPPVAPATPRVEVIAERAPSVAGGDPADIVCRLIAERAEIPIEAIGPTSRMLGDLHLTSIAVAEIAVEAARRLGLPPPGAVNELAGATIGELAQALADPRREAPASRSVEPPGTGAWVRPFAIDWVERPLTPAEADPGSGGWQVFAPPGNPFAEPLVRALDAEGGEGVALCVPTIEQDGVARLLDAARTALTAPRFLVVQGPGGVAAGLARSVHLEAPGCDVAVVTLPFDDHAAQRAAAEAVAARGFVEVRYSEDGRRLEPVLRRLMVTDAGGPLPVGPGDIALVTGGARGIAAECMLHLAQASGMALAILGRSDPADEEVAANLERMRAAGVHVRYARADVADATAVRAAVAAIGPVTAVVHAAGANEPRLLADADLDLFAHTLRPKVQGLEHVLAAVDRDQLRMLVTFGSIIARIGMRGDGHYALANEWQSALTERFAAEHPRCACLAFESSVWSAVGMGERLGSIAALARQGVHAIAPEEGTALLTTLLRASDRPTSVVATGRFGRPPTLRAAHHELPLLRFVERPLVHYAGIELVTDVALGEGLDPYLDDHVLHGDRLVPAVMGLEAMAQAIAALTGSSATPVFEDMRLAQPLVAPLGERTIIRVAVLANDGVSGTVALRSERTGFAVDHFTARWRLDGGPPRGDPIELGAHDAVDLDADDLYGSILFQSGRFRRLRGYRRLTATECVAVIEPATPTDWFGSYLPQQLVLGDPGARDAALHAVQACIPHVRVVPVAVRSVAPGTGDAPGPWFVHARETHRDGDEFVYDLVMANADGSVRERWDGLRLRAVAAAAVDQPWPEALLAPFVERHLPAGVRVALTRAAPAQDRRERSRVAVARALGAPVCLRHRPDGRPEADAWPGEVSTSHANGLTLAVAGPGRVACDLETVARRAWSELLGDGRAALTDALARTRGGDADACATRVWAAAECLAKAGVAPGAPLTLARDGEDDGWVVLACGSHAVATYVARVRGTDRPLALAVLAEGVGDARV
jgi:enediyne polyketide synthase